MIRFYDAYEDAGTEIRLAVFKRYRVAHIALVLLPLAIALAILAANGFLLSIGVWNNIASQILPLLFLTPGFILVLKQGEIDLSVAALASLSAAIFGTVVIGRDGGFVVATLATVGAATALGALQGALVGYAKIPSFAVSFVGANVFQLLAVSIVVGPPELLNLSAPFYDLFAPLGLLIVGGLIAVIAWFTPRASDRLFPAADNRTALSVSRVASFGFMGLLAGVAGVASILRVGSTNAFFGNGLEVQVLLVALAAGFFFRRTRSALLWGAIGCFMYGVVRFVTFLADADVYLRFTITNGLLVLYAAAFLIPSLIHRPSRRVRRQQWVILAVALGFAFATAMLWFGTEGSHLGLSAAQLVSPAALLVLGTIGYVRNREHRLSSPIDTREAQRRTPGQH